MSIDQFSGEADFLMDENILTNESRDEDELKRNSRTPHTIKTQNQNQSIN